MKLLLAFSLLFSILIIPVSAKPIDNAIPVLYTTDLFHPKDDADDTYDLAALYSLPNIDIKGIVLEQGLKQDVRSGGIVVDQLNRITKKKIPYKVGLANPLQSKSDQALDQDVKYQGGVDMILETLKKSKKRVSIITVGSLRDVAAAYNRNPDLFHRKLDRLLVFAGEAKTEMTEYNVALDTNAYAQIMNSGLNIFWVPCFDGGVWNNEGNASFWRTEKQSDLLEGIDPKLMRYFVYNLMDKTSDPMSYLSQRTNLTDVDTVFNDYRNLWCTVIFKAINGSYDRDIFDFKPVTVRFTDEGFAKYDSGKPLMRFEVTDKENYSEKMTEETNKMLRKLVASTKGDMPKSFDTILALGTSITNGYNVETAWPLRLQSLIDTNNRNATVIKDGINGIKTDAMITELETALNSSPDVVILETSINDTNPDNNFTYTHTMDNMIKMVEMVQDTGAMPVLTTPTPIDPSIDSPYFNTVSLERINQLAALIRDYAEEEGIPLIDNNKSFNSDYTLLGDKIHPNDTGAQLMAETAYDIIYP